jgi:hypothetical protein
VSYLTSVATNSNPYDLINPHLATTNSFMVIVREVNVPPILTAIPAQVANQAYLFTVTNTATEPNIHSLTTSYTLLIAPIGMNIDPAEIITWTPSQAQSPSTNTVITVVTNSNPYDLVNPHLSASNSFAVVVHPAVVLTNSTLSFSSGGFQCGFDTFPGINYIIQYTTNLHDWFVLSILSGTGGHTNFLDSDALRDRHRFYRIHVEE